MPGCRPRPGFIRTMPAPGPKRPPPGWRKRCRDPRVVACGEIGLDYHYDHSPRDTQRAVFERQMALAESAGKPVVIHAREADADVAAVLQAFPAVTAILHSFSSGPSLFEAGVALGHYVSFSGMVTFRSWALDDLVRATPADRLLVETDAPYLAPGAAPRAPQRAGLCAAGRRAGREGPRRGASRRHFAYWTECAGGCSATVSALPDATTHSRAPRRRLPLLYLKSQPSSGEFA